MYQSPDTFQQSEPFFMCQYNINTLPISKWDHLSLFSTMSLQRLRGLVHKCDGLIRELPAFMSTYIFLRFFLILPSNFAQAATFMTCICEVLGSNLGQDTYYVYLVFHSHQANELGLDRFLHSYKFQHT
jgi:hypothetical protein